MDNAAHKELIEKLRLIEVEAGDLVRLCDSIDAGVYLEHQRAAIELMQNMLRRWQRWQLREALLAFGLAECDIPCPQRAIIGELEERGLTAGTAGNTEKVKS